jgi:hypothetical protein
MHPPALQEQRRQATELLAGVQQGFESWLAATSDT